MDRDRRQGATSPSVHSFPTGINVGIAPAASIHCIKVLDDNGSGSLSNVIAGINMVVGYQKANPGRRMVASLSLGAAFNTLVNQAVQALLDAGVVPVVAAGNSNIVRQTVTRVWTTPQPAVQAPT